MKASRGSARAETDKREKTNRAAGSSFFISIFIIIEKLLSGDNKGKQKIRAVTTTAKIRGDGAGGSAFARARGDDGA